MKADPGPDPLARALADARRATEALEPPDDFPARVLALTAAPRRRVNVAMWAQLAPVSRRIVPLAALAAAAALVLAWSSDSRLDDTGPSALELAQEMW